MISGHDRYYLNHHLVRERRGIPPSPILLQCADDVYLLDAAEAAGSERPFSGRSGSDSTSTARLLSGTVDQRDQVFLSDEQVRAGCILTEVVYPRSDCVVVVVVVVGVEGELYGL